MAVNQMPCVFCNSQLDVPELYGNFESHERSGLIFHEFCKLLSSGLFSSNDNNDVTRTHYKGYAIRDINKELRRARKKICRYCRENGATIGCCQSRCRISFHLPCGINNKALSIFADNYESYCVEHRPRPAYIQDHDNFKNMLNEQLAPTERQVSANIQCIACLEELTPPFEECTVLKPECCEVYVHKGCFQKMAFNAGLHHFRCPTCNNV